MTDVEAAWAAGLYEGEGSVTVMEKASGRPSLQFCLGSTDADVLHRFFGVVGVGHIRGPYVRGKRKPFWTWSAHGYDVARLILDSFGPHLGERRLKRLKEVIALEPPPRKRMAARNRKLTTEQAGSIRERLANGETQMSLSREFHITQAQIWRIKEGLTYPEPVA